MKSRKFPISLYILVPLIFSGIALISAIVSHYLTLVYLKGGATATPAVFFLWISLLLLFTLICSYLVISRVLKPVIKFIKDSENLPIMPPSPEGLPLAAKASPEYYERIFQQVTDILGMVESRELFPHIVGQSVLMRNLFTQMIKVAPTDTTVLILGESGTGKELIATAIYEHSRRRAQAFIKINCVAIPEGLLESELFGHEKGAFTGAVSHKKGKFELAHGGTIFLDEIGDMPLSTQAKLLRVLQEKEFERVGGVKPIKVDVRFIAATNKNLEQLVQTGSFREDLYFRLSVFPVMVPPLRARREDIPLLCRHFLAGYPVKEISPAAMQILMSYHWPGNVRQLRNVIERAVVLTNSPVIDDCHLPPELQVVNGRLALSAESGLEAKLAALEKALIIEALNRALGVQARAAELLGINQRSLWHRIKKHNIDVASFKRQRQDHPERR